MALGLAHLVGRGFCFSFGPLASVVSAPWSESGHLFGAILTAAVAAAEVVDVDRVGPSASAWQMISGHGPVLTSTSRVAPV